MIRYKVKFHCDLVTYEPHQYGATIHLLYHRATCLFDPFSWVRCGGAGTGVPYERGTEEWQKWWSLELDYHKTRVQPQTYFLNPNCEIAKAIQENPEGHFSCIPKPRNRFQAIFGPIEKLVFENGEVYHPDDPFLFDIIQVPEDTQDEIRLAETGEWIDLKETFEQRAQREAVMMGLITVDGEITEHGKVVQKRLEEFEKTFEGP